MFKIESYVTPILLSYVDKYVRDFKPADAQVSLWGGGVALHNLVLKADVLQQEVALPFTLVSGRIHELLIHVPWTKIISEPIIVTIDTIECVLSLNPPAPDESPPPESPSRKTQVVEAPPGYMQALVRRIVSNIALRVHHLIVKYVQDDIVMSLNVKHLAVDSAAPTWEPAFADIDQNHPVIRRLMRLDDFTLCLDKTDSDGKIRFYQEPLLYRCQLDLRILTRLVSANTRRASSLSIQLRSSKLAWGVTSDQLTLLLRLMRERGSVDLKPSPPAPKSTSTSMPAPLHATSSNSAEPARSESWSDWAWSWLPTWIDREGGAEEAPMPATPTPVYFTAYLDNVSLVFKVMELDGGSRKRARGVLELSASHAAIKSTVCSPTTLRVKIGARALLMTSNGKCVCGHIDAYAANDEPTVYLRRAESDAPGEAWKWPDDQFGDAEIETAEAAEEHGPKDLDVAGVGESQYGVNTQGHQDLGQPEEPPPEPAEPHDHSDEFWIKMAPLVLFEYTHARSPPAPDVNPYDNPPRDFQYSDWVEECNLSISLDPVEFTVCMGLLHRLAALRSIYQDPEPDQAEVPVRVLTVEECEALSDNVPQRRVTVETRGVRVRIEPWDHSPTERSTKPPVVVDVDLPRSTVVANGPLYPLRVCSAACQMPEDSGPLWQGARLHVTAVITAVQVQICSPGGGQPRPCARFDIRLVGHTLLYKEFFTKRESVRLSYSVKIREANMCGSAARLEAAWHVPTSLMAGRASLQLKYTTLANDALNDEESVAMDVTLEEMCLRGYITGNINTHILTLQTAKATALHELKGDEMKQAWLFSAPDAPTTTPYLRLATQWCSRPVPNSLDYVGAWTEPLAVCVDPLFIAWLAYKPTLKPLVTEGPSALGLTRTASSQYFMRRRITPPSSSGRGGSRSGSGAELVHVRPRSLGSSSEPSEKKETNKSSQQDKGAEDWWCGDRLLPLHQRLRRMLVSVELGLTLLYVPLTTASAIDCETLRDAMERHASASHKVLAVSLGRLSLYSSLVTKHLWHDIRHDGPTFINPKTNDNSENDSFPWKMRLADVSCYTLEVHAATDRKGREKSSSGLRSQLRVPCVAHPRTVLEHVTTSVTLSVVTKALAIKTAVKPDQAKKQYENTVEEEEMKYFKTGMEFKPTTLREFVRGPARRKKPGAEQTEPKPGPAQAPATTVTSGPVVSLGVHIHADTPPIIVRLDHDQVHVMAAAVHCLNHILVLLQRAPITDPKVGHTTVGEAQRSLIKSVSEMDETQTRSERTPSENPSELISIFEAKSAQDLTPKLKSFFWLQWVVSRATLVVATYQVKLAFDVDDIISTVDLQAHYNQFKVKLASASVRHYERLGSDEWTAGVLGGRVLEAREPSNVKEENHFLAVTVTQALISNLPASWREEMNPKVLDTKPGEDSMWEIYATLAPLEAVLEPAVLDNVMSLSKEMMPRSFCPLQAEDEQRPCTWQWPFCYVTAGGLRLLITAQENKHADDTFMIVIGKVTVSPFPENPICRRAVNPAADSWLSGGGGLEGRQYEILVKNFAARSAQFRQLVHQEASEAEMLKGTVGENPALKWSQPVVSPVITPVLHSVDVSCVLAPALYASGALACGPAVELNLVSDCAIELSVEQLTLARRILADISESLQNSDAEGLVFDEEKHGVCPYATLLMQQEAAFEEPGPSLSDLTLTEEASEMEQSLAADSGVDTVTSQSHIKASGLYMGNAHLKKSVSVGFVDQESEESSDHLEVFVTMGMIELSLYTADDSSPEVIALRAPRAAERAARGQTPEPVLQVIIDEKNEPSKWKEVESPAGSRSLTDAIRNEDIAKTQLELHVFPHARKVEGNLPLLHVTLYQPNLYYWKRRTQNSLQVSLFNAWVGLGVGQIAHQWHAALLSTAKGVPDPVTDIPPALATMKLMAPSNGVHGTIRLDVERPVMLEVCTDRLRRVQGILALIEDRVSPPSSEGHRPEKPTVPALYKLKRFLMHQSMDSITIQTSQIGVSGSEGTVGWDACCAQIAVGDHPKRLVVRGLLTALLVAAGPPGDHRHLLLQPLMLGTFLEATWEAWRRVEGGQSAREPTLRVNLELDRVVLDLRPADLAALNRMQQTLAGVLGTKDQPPVPRNSSESFYRTRTSAGAAAHSNIDFDRKVSATSVEANEPAGHYYKDDLRSGAFKILSGGQLPMAYQVTLHKSAVSWRYPHPRAITRLVVFPLPGLDQEIECVLELYSPMLARWEAHTYFKLPLSEPRELQLHVPPPDAVFAVMWRFRTYSGSERKHPPFEFNVHKFMPRSEPLVVDAQPDLLAGKCVGGVTAEQLSGVLRVDSYFAPRMLPRTKLVVRLVALEVNLHNALPYLSSQVTALEGYYVSRPLMRSHRVLTVSARDSTAHAQLGSPAGHLLLVDTQIDGDVLDCATGTMEQLIDQFRMQGCVSFPKGGESRARACATSVHAALHVPRLRTLHALAADWRLALDQYIRESSSSSTLEEPTETIKSKRELAAVTAAALEGRVSLWVHNSCAVALRIGQEGTDEVVPMGPGARLAYRWGNPTAPKRLRLSLAGPSADWRWSSSIPFTAGSNRVRLEDAESLGGNKQTQGGGVYVHVSVGQDGARRCLQLGGRLALANMLRFDLHYKVRSRCLDSNLWQTVCSGELSPETFGRSVVCGADCELVLKIKFAARDTGWSGDIPLKECPKENVPWLVKVPSAGDTPYMSVWCRVVRARSDGRVLASVWPLYALHSHLPLDTDVLIVTETATSSPELVPGQTHPAPLIQTAPGRGASTHLLAPGTTAAKHSLSFQYRDIECPVTREAVPLHYGVTDTSVFDKRAPVVAIDEVIDEIVRWLQRSGRNSQTAWPYSVVTKHWPGTWSPALVQPRCDVNVRYEAVRAGGGCCLELQLCPAVLLCNAAPLALTLRAHDAAPLCKVEPGAAISPPSALLKKPFFMSVELGRETFVSGQLAVSGSEPGRYGVPPPGQVTLDHPANFAIQCNHKVALLTLYYEIRKQINVLGVSSTYVLINRLDTNILVSAIAVPNEFEDDVVLNPKTFKVVEPTKEGSILGTPLCRFWVRGRWRGGCPTELRAFLCVALHAGAGPAHAPAPVHLGGVPVRRAISLYDHDNRSVPVVVTQVRHDGRWLVTVAHDPCPQFVVHNRTGIPLAIAQPARVTDEQSTSYVLASPECTGARWWCVVYPETVTHYSTPAHCARYPPPPLHHPAPARSSVPFVTFAKAKDEGAPDWSAPAAVTDGEQLVQLWGLTVKLRVRTHPHTTHLELQDVHEYDISASDIRRRLLGAFSEESFQFQTDDGIQIKRDKLERVDAVDKLMERTSKELPQQQGGTSNASITPSASSEPTEVRDSSAWLNNQPGDNSTVVLFCEAGTRYQDTEEQSQLREFSPDRSCVFEQNLESEWEESVSLGPRSRFRAAVSGLAVEVSAAADARPLLALRLDRLAVLLRADHMTMKTALTIADVQIDNLQYDCGLYDFAVVATTRAEPLAADRWPPLWNMFAERDTFSTRQDEARVLLKIDHDTWTVLSYKYRAVTEVDIRVGPLALYVEDAYVTALVELSRLAFPPSAATDEALVLTEERSLQAPLRLRTLHIHPLDLTLTLHTAVRMYIALDQSPLRLSAFKLHDVMTSADRLTHALTVHYLSAAILGAGWVVGGLELLGAPGALAARVGGATGGVRGVASAAAAALLRSLSAWAGSLARNLDLLAGDEEHARRAAAARRRPPQSLVAGLVLGITNFAINILGAVGGLAHHPLVGVAVGETESGAAALRRGLIGALTKPLSATADLVAYAGHGLLSQTGWDPIPQPRRAWPAMEERSSSGWRRDCVRWSFRLAELTAVAGFEVLLDTAPLQLLLTHKFLVVADPDSERIVEMIDLRFCTLGPHHGQIIEMRVVQRRQSKLSEARVDEDDEYQINAAAMARVALYTGAASATVAATSATESRVLKLLPAPGREHALRAALAAALHHNADTHFPLL